MTTKAGATSPSSLSERVREIAADCPLAAEWRDDGSDPTRCVWCVRWMGRHPRSPFCSRHCSTEFWANHSWKAAKEARKQAAGRKCERCGKPSKATHQVHHKEGAREGGRTRLAACDHHQDRLEFLCAGCHREDHHGGNS